uniref:Uncharacterized protein n=1 Tax=Acrobeloides nanus TaxID=290746 RepID=A0A914E7L0_9BILA
MNGINKIDNLTYVTLLYVGDSVNNIMIVSRIPEYHTANCTSEENLLYVSLGYYYKEITASDDGSCVLSLLIPFSFDKNANYFMKIDSPKYDAVEKGYIVAGYDQKYTLFDFNNDTVHTLSNLRILGIIVSFIIPPGATLAGFYSTSKKVVLF